MTIGDLVRRQSVRLHADPTRVIAHLFVPGHALPGGNDRVASGVVEHVIELDDDTVDETLAEIMDRFGSRHRDLPAMLRHHADRIRNRLHPGVRLSEQRWLLLGAVFTQENAVAAAAMCNPSAVAHPDQSAVPTGSMRFLMSVRQIGEGHRSTIGFRSGLLDEHGSVTVDAPGPFTTAATIAPSVLDAEALRDGAEATDWVLGRLGAVFTSDELDVQLAQLEGQRDTRRDAVDAVRRLRARADRSYTASFPASSVLSERVLYPAMTAEANGVEDARFVRFTDGATVGYRATYVAYDGANILQQLLMTDDFLTFRSSPLRGHAADNKGLALFPRLIGDRFAALSRHDGVENAITFSADGHSWSTATPLARGKGSWESIHVGNCGSPIETADGWLVLTHGVGPMRTYSIGAMLLDIDDPTRVIGRLPEPLLSPSPDEQDGYVPNVVYSCGSVAHGDRLLIPYGIGDVSIGFATARVSELIDAMTSCPSRDGGKVSRAVR